jgi:undecaprenyl phosphate N,N'-diacetylbacillosamine 1-phosphate transferase
MIYRFFFKRILDLIIALIGFMLLLPIFTIVALTLAFSNRGTPFFSQRRPGKNEKIFRVIKFKTMNNEMDLYGKLLPDRDRLTPLGNFIRSTSLDEIPQLLNVIKGDMSIVGPRPLLESYLGIYNDVHKHRHDIRPGITGWAQVNGRNALEWSDKFDLDIYYLNNLTFALDLKIIFITIRKVVKRSGINFTASNRNTYFTGYSKQDNG